MLIINNIRICWISFGEVAVTASPPVDINMLPRIFNTKFCQAVFHLVPSRPKQGSIILGAAVDIVWIGIIN